MQRRHFLLVLPAIGIGATIEQNFGYGRIGATTGKVQRGATAAIRGVWIGIVVGQQVYDILDGAVDGTAY